MQADRFMAFGGSGLRRAAELRGDAAGVERMWRGARVLPMWRGKPAVLADAGLVRVASENAVVQGTGARVFLGLGEDGVAEFAYDLSDWNPETGEGAEQGFFDQSRQPHPALGEGPAFEDLRNAMMRLSPREAELAAMARALLHWHRSHAFCAACGARSVLGQAGWQRQCPSCGAQHFPRTDPVVIMLVTRGNRLLLGRNAVWPEGMYSLLAGFVEPGETLEAAVRREVAEETGVRVGPVRMLASQPWPFPANLMLGAHGHAETEAIALDPDELQDALWISREDLLQVFAGTHPRIKPPRKGAIAETLMRNWLADRLS